MMNQPHLGIDFGGVIIPMVDRTRGADTQLSDRFLTTAPHPDAFERITDLVGIFAGHAWIISKAGQRTQALTRQWLHRNKFFQVTGLAEDHLRFCRERVRKESICKELGITHFVDDRIHIMQVLRKTVANLYLFGPKSENHSAQHWTTLVENWAEAHEAIMRDL